MINSEYNSNKADQNGAFQESNTENQNNPEAARKDVVSNSAQQRAISESEAMARDIKEGRLSGFVGSNAIFMGDLNFTAMARIDGLLTGNIMSEKGTLIIGSDGIIDGNVSVATTIINGTVNGDVIAVEHLELKRTAKVVGNIQTPCIIMESGASLEGNCSMLKVKDNLENNKDEQDVSIAPVSSNVVKNNLYLPHENKTGINPLPEKIASEAVGKDEESSEFNLEINS